MVQFTITIESVLSELSDVAGDSSAVVTYCVEMAAELDEIAEIRRIAFEATEPSCVSYTST